MPAEALAAMPPVDLPRFMGTWHVVAHIPYFFENGKVATRDVYRLRPDDRIDNDFVFKTRFEEPDRTWNGVSTVVDGSGSREWGRAMHLAVLDAPAGARGGARLLDCDPRHAESQARVDILA